MPPFEIPETYSTGFMHHSRRVWRGPRRHAGVHPPEQESR